MWNTPRLLVVSTVIYLKQLSRSPFQIATSIIAPVVQATLAVYLFRAGNEPHRLLEAAVGAGLMGVWSSVLFGSGGAIQSQRWMGTLELLVLAPRSTALALLPITVANALTGTYALIATLLWGLLLYGVRLDFADPLGFAVAAPVCVLALGAFGLLLATTFVLMRNANALTNALEYPIWLLSGMLVPITVLPAWTGPLAAALPTTWGARALQGSITGDPVWRPLLVCAAISLLYGLAGGLLMSYVERRARAAATLALA